MNCTNTFNVFKRETAAYFNAPIAYIFTIVFILLSSSLYMAQFFVVGVADMRPFFLILPYILAVFMPAVTMRLWAEEKRGNTLELLLTFPMRTQDIVIGKFKASFLFYLAALAGTLPIPVMLEVLGNPDPGMMLGGYLGAIFLGAFYLAIGIFISGFCRDQIVAFILAMVVCFGLHLIGTDFMASSIDSWMPGFGSFLSQFLGSAGHFESFAKGVMDSRDILYFVVGIVIFLALNGVWLEGRMKPGSKKLFTAAAVISIGIFLTGNWFLSGISMGRYDLTEGKIYTTSEATKRILKGLKVPVTAKFYVSPVDKMPTGMKTLEQDVIDKLDELRIAANGNFQYKIFHMEAANVMSREAGQEESLEQQLEKKGIQPYQVRAIEADEVQVRLVYSALTLAYKEKAEEIIPRITPDNMHEMEYRVMSKVFRMTMPEMPAITLVAPFEEKQLDPQMASLLKQLGGQVPEAYREDAFELLERALQYEGYNVTRIKKISKEEPIPAGTKTLVMVGPESLSERERYEINRFLHGGGTLFLAVQQYQYQYDMTGGSLKIVPQKMNPEINALLSEWGFEVDDYVLVDEQHDVINLSGAARMGPFEVAVPVKAPIQILVTESGMNPDVSITSRLSPIFYLWGTSVKVFDTVKNTGLKVETLLSSSKSSWTVPMPQTGELTPNSLIKQQAGRSGPFPLALMVQGQFADIWKEREVPAWSADVVDASQPAAAEEKPSAVTPAPGKMVLIGAAMPFQKNLLQSGGHLNFFINAVDALALGDELITIRSKQPIDRSFGRVSAASKIAWRTIATLGVPVLIAALGFIRMLMRRQAKQNYLKSLAAASV
jgi:ABC-2 type transport system permease protein